MNTYYRSFFITAALCIWTVMAVTSAASANTGNMGMGNTPQGRPFQYIQSQIVDLHAQIMELVGDVSSLEEYLAAAQAAIDNLEAENAVQQVQIDALTATVADLQSQIDANKDQIQVLQGQVADHSSQIQALEADTAYLQAQINANDGDISTLQNQVSTNQQNIVSLFLQISTLNSTILQLQAQNASLQQQVTANDGDISNLYGLTSSNNTAISTLQTQVSNINTVLSGKQAKINSNCASDEAIQYVNPNTGAVSCVTISQSGSVSIAYVHSLTTTLWYFSPSATVDCPAGYKVTGGGVQYWDFDLLNFFSLPSMPHFFADYPKYEDESTQDNGVGWRVNMMSSLLSFTPVRVHAVCVQG